MRKVLYLLLLASLFFVPLQRVEIAKLLPVEAVAVYMDGNQVVLETDTEHIGTGNTAEEALESLKIGTPKIIYLDTAEYLLVAEDAVSQVDHLRQYLKPSTKVCVCDARGGVKNTAEYLDVHEKLPKLRHWKPENYTS